MISYFCPSLFQCEIKKHAATYFSKHNCFVSRTWVLVEHGLVAWRLYFSLLTIKNGTSVEFSKQCSLYISLPGEEVGALCYEYKLNRLVLKIGCPFNHLTSYKRSALIQKPSVQIPKTYNQHGIAGKKKNLGINTLTT